MSRYQVVEEYPRPIDQVWRAMTDPALVPRWTATGRGGRPVGFGLAVGTRFQFVGKPVPGWNGIVDCEVLEVEAPSRLRYSWQSGEGSDLTMVTYRLETRGERTVVTIEHDGFRGVGGWLNARLLGHVRKKMLRVGLRNVLGELSA